MSILHKKLTSQSGVTILIALVGFMVAAMISVVIISAAVTSARRVADDKKENQARLTLESAAEIIRSGIEDTEYTFSSYQSGSMGSAGLIDTIGINKYDATGTFAYEMKTAVSGVNIDTDTAYTSDQNTDFKIELTSDTSGTVKPVTVSFVMKNGEEKYDLIFTLKLEDSEQEMYVTADGYCTDQKADDNLYHIRWNVISINGLGDEIND